MSDRGIEFILMLFHSFIKIIAQCANNEKVQFLLVQLPKNIYKLRKIFGHYKKEFDKFAVCPKCSACHKIPSSASTNSTCSAKSEFSKKTCGAELLRKVKCGKKYKFVPKKIYIYSPLKLSLSRLFQKRNSSQILKNGELGCLNVMYCQMFMMVQSTLDIIRSLVTLL